jgi:hypothetical protein
MNQLGSHVMDVSIWIWIGVDEDIELTTDARIVESSVE